MYKDVNKESREEDTEARMQKKESIQINASSSNSLFITNNGEVSERHMKQGAWRNTPSADGLGALFGSQSLIVKIRYDEHGIYIYTHTHR